MDIDFTYEAEAESLAARYSPSPTDGRMYGLNRFVKKLTAGGVWPLIDAAWCLRAGSEANSLVQLKASAFGLTKTSTPTFTANRGWVSDASTKYLDTTWNPVDTQPDVADFHFGIYSGTAALNAASDAGMASGGNGISLNVGTATGAVAFRANGPLVTTTATGISNGEGFVLVSVSDGVYSMFVNGDLKETGAYSPAALVDLEVYLLAVNGGASVSGRSLCFATLGKALTAAQAKAYHCAVQSYLDNFLGGWPNVFEPGYSPETVDVDFVAYGATLQGVVAAREAARQGLSAVIVGGWRDFIGNLGGMTACGLGATDYDTIDALGGLPRLIITRTNTLMGQSANNKNLNPRHTQQIIRSLLDSGRSDGAAIPVYFSTGIASVAKSAGRITAMTTRDGRTFTAAQWSDCSYEGDLMAEAGCSYIVGREAAGTGNEAFNGFRGVELQDGGQRSQYFLTEGTFDESGTLLTGGPYYDIDPYVVEGSPSSGLLDGILPEPTESDGQADAGVMSYSIRATLSKNPWHRSAIPDTAPPGFTMDHYEPFLRLLAALAADSKTYGEGNDFTIGRLGGTSDGTRTLFSPVLLPDGSWDFNTFNGFGPNMFGNSWTWAEATISEREALWQEHVNHVRGLWYLMAHGRTVEGDTRVPAAMESDAQAWGFHAMSYCDQNDLDTGTEHIPPQVYVRECRRLKGMLTYDGNDLDDYADGDLSRSGKTIGCASYKIDSHIVSAHVDPNGGSPRIWNHGMLSVDVTGETFMSPIFYEAIVPKRGQANNLTVTFCASTTHVSFTAVRMEFPCAALAQAAGLAAAIAEEEDCAIQDVPYATLRARLLTSNTLSGEVDPVIPEVFHLQNLTTDESPLLANGLVLRGIVI